MKLQKKIFHLFYSFILNFSSTKIDINKLEMNNVLFLVIYFTNNHLHKSKRYHNRKNNKKSYIEIFEIMYIITD